MNDWVFVSGGGCGDIVQDYLHDTSSWLFKTIVEDYAGRIWIHLCTHNPGSLDLFRYNPYVSKLTSEPWQLPSQESFDRLNNPIDGWLPMRNGNFLWKHIAHDAPRHEPQVYIDQAEQQQLHELFKRRPLIVLQPWAGLSDRDAMDSAAVERLVKECAKREPNCAVVVTGYNHERGHKYQREELFFEHPNLVNLVDKVGIRFTYHLLKHCDAFAGCHSSLILLAWDFRKRNACILPWPHEQAHIERLDPKYAKGWKYPESSIFRFPYEVGAHHLTERHFEQLDCEAIARFLLQK